jgi:glycerol-3-phosphate cytidylyltransferase-like family protein
LRCNLNSIERIVHNKNRIPTHRQQERASNLLALRSVDMVLMLPLLNGFEDYNTLVRTVSPTVIATTQGDPQLINKQKQAHLLGIDCVIVTEHIGTFSSSAIYEQHQE